MRSVNILTALFALTTLTAMADTIAYNTNGGTVGNQSFAGSLGMDFNTTGPINITQLGTFDSSGNGLSSPITVQIWNRDNLAAGPLATVIFSCLNQGTLVNGERFLSLKSPLALQAGFQGSVVAFGYNPDDPNGNATPSSQWSTNSGGGLINFVGTGRFSNTAGAFPAIVDGGSPNSYAAGTFQFTAATPEPASLGLVGAGLAAAAFAARRRKA